MDLKEPAFKNITEVSKELHIPQYVLRFWEKEFKQISPVKRKGGRRFYRTEDVNTIKTIKELLYDKGYTIKGAKRVLGGSDELPLYDDETEQDKIRNTIELLKQIKNKL